MNRADFSQFSAIPQETCAEPLISLMFLTWDPVWGFFREV